MSRHDRLRTSVAIALVLLGGAMARAQVLRTQPGPLERQAKPVTPENPIPKRVYFVMPTRPGDIDLAAGRAVVTLRLTLDGAGSVAEIRSGFGGLMAVGNGLAASDAFIEATADASSLVMYGGMALPGGGATLATIAARPATRALGRRSGAGRRRCPCSVQDQERAADVSRGGVIRTPPGCRDPRGALAALELRAT